MVIDKELKLEDHTKPQAHRTHGWFVQVDKYALEGLRESSSMYLTRNIRTIRAEAQHMLTKLVRMIQEAPAHGASHKSARLRCKLQDFDRHSLYLVGTVEH